MSGPVSVCGKNFNVSIFLDAVNMIDVKLCMIELEVLVELYPFIPFSVNLIAFQGHSSVKYFQLKILCSYLVKLKCCIIVDYVK